MAAFGLLVVRLFTLQVIQGGRYRQLAEENRIKTIRIAAPRGEITDRNGITLAGGDRLYPLKEAAGHVTGYVGEVGEEEVGLLLSGGGKYVAEQKSAGAE